MVTYFAFIVLKKAKMILSPHDSIICSVPSYLFCRLSTASATLVIIFNFGTNSTKVYPVLVLCKGRFPFIVLLVYSSLTGKLSATSYVVCNEQRRDHQNARREESGVSKLQWPYQQFSIIIAAPYSFYAFHGTGHHALCTFCYYITYVEAKM